jgi:hypothetical protein
VALLIDFVENEFTFDALENDSVADDDDDIASILRPKSNNTLLKNL